MGTSVKVSPKVRPPLDPDFLPAVLWNKAYQELVRAQGGGREVVFALERANGNVSVHRTRVLPDEPAWRDINTRYAERLVKNLLWMRGGWKVTVAGAPDLAHGLGGIYGPAGGRRFDCELIGTKVYGRPIEVEACPLAEAPVAREAEIPLGGYLDGCRIGFDLGGSDRKCAAVHNGEVVFSEEVKWDPYFQSDPSWHRAGIADSIRRAAAHLPRVDAIGGSAAGVYVDNEVRVASLFRGVSDADFQAHVKGLFIDLGREWNVPFVVVNDGEVTALAGALSLGVKSVLGIAMGTSEAAGYTTPEGKITDWLNELAFAPIDYRENAPADEWSGDLGCGVQYLSQQAVARLAPAAGFDFPSEMPFAQRLEEVQKAMAAGDRRATSIYESIGVYLGYAVAHYADFYALHNLLILGRVMSGPGGDIILSEANRVLASEFPEIHRKIVFRSLDEKGKRHGQAIAAASLARSAGGAR